ncbi:MAG: CDP-diacylglycerol--serine O-phosphatidyltransferase [Verrucomicrobia bacterium]|nr:CDP-diacylglycerol--serine O-phosphatidyltransferase [Verrucomicrobiota bacterium]
MPDNTKPTPPPSNGNGTAADAKLKIYFLPNLLTAGNLFCGFVALTKIVEADITGGDYHDIWTALYFILAACIFDLFDGRVARMVGADSPFGREFDSLADLISFGAAPAFLVHRIVLKDVFIKYAEIGWFIASIYLVCGAFRLARYNVMSSQPGAGGGKEFLGFPIPSAAALVASLTMFMIWLNDNGWMEERFTHSRWRYMLPVLMVFLSCMMVSRVKYPSFKVFDIRTTRSFPGMLGAILLLGVIVVSKGKALIFLLPIFFTAYLVYGFIRPRLSRQTRRDIIEEEDDDEPSKPD